MQITADERREIAYQLQRLVDTFNGLVQYANEDGGDGWINGVDENDYHEVRSQIDDLARLLGVTIFNAAVL